MLPASYTLPAHLLEIEPEPFTAGGSSDVYKATFRGSGVCVKRVRVYIQDGPQTPAKVRCRRRRFPCLPLLKKLRSSAKRP